METNLKEENLKIYNSLKVVPIEAQKKITGGRLSGMTDIKPMWRIEKLTETFGMCGIGWKTIIKNKEIIEGANGEKIAIVDIDLFVKVNNEWSQAIEGTGGSSFIAKEKSGLYTSDECFKMAYTDALSVACKSLGMGANIYWGDSKYNDTKKIETVEEAKKYKITFGKYSGKTLGEVVEVDSKYCDWLLNKEDADPIIKNCINLITKKQLNKSKTDEKVIFALESQIEQIKNLINEEQIKQACKLVKKEKLEEFTIEEASNLIKSLKKTE